MTFLRRTWLAAALCGLLSMAIWFWLADWRTSLRQLLQTVLLTPPVWWYLVGRHQAPRLWRGVAGGALAGLLTQVAQLIPGIWRLISLRGTYKGDDAFAAMAELVAFLTIGFWSTTLGASAGLVLVLVQRRVGGESAVPD